MDVDSRHGVGWERRHRRFREHSGSDGPGQAASDRGHGTSLVRAAVTDRDAFTRRTYTTAGLLQAFNTNGSNNFARAYSLHFQYNTTDDTCDCSIYEGSPQAGVGTDTTLQFQNLRDEFQALTNVFRYFKITKFQINVKKLPMPVYIPSQPVNPPQDPPDPSEQQQGGTWTNMGDPGRFLVRPWTGAPGIASYADGTLTAVDWDDHYRYKLKKVESAVGVSHPLKFAARPMQPVIIPDQTSPADPSGVVRYDFTPAIDISNFSTGAVDGSSYGLIFFWYYPSCVNAITGLLNTDLEFEIEIEYFGLKPPSAFTPAPPPLADGAVYVDSKEALIASMMNERVKTLPRPPKPARPVINTAEQKVENELSTAMSDVVVVPKVQVNQQAAMPNPPPNTPKVGIPSLIKKK